MSAFGALSRLSLLAAAGAVAAELGARAAIRRYGGYYRYAPNLRGQFEIDRDALPELGPIARWNINADGERGGPAPRVGEDVFRGLVVGGSAAECSLLDYEQTWAFLVERAVQASGRAGTRRVHIGNVARAILPCRDVTFMLQKILPRYGSLDLVLVMVGAADVVSWIERGMPREIDPRPRGVDSIFEQHPEGPWGSQPRKTALWRLAAGLRRAIGERPAHQPGGDWLHRVRRMRRDAARMIDEVPEATPMLERFEADLTTLLTTARTAAKHVVLVRQPWRHEVPEHEQGLLWNFGLGRPYREEVKAYFTTRVVDALMRMVDARAAEVADRLAVSHVDLMPHLAQTREVFYDELHFTPRGAETVGKVVAEAVLRELR